MKEVLKRIIKEFHLDTGKIITIVGPRRSGKMYLKFQTMNTLVERGVKKKIILYVNFEDERLLFEEFDYDDIFIAYKELYPHIKEKDVYIF